jgi:pseudaminic acid biosynthesis-associated methylase
MPAASQSVAEADRLEAAWAGEFGDAYIERNRSAHGRRGDFWRRLLASYPARSVLEVGCNIGGNLQHIEAGDLCGLDVNANALAELKRRYPHVTAVESTARYLPFVDRSFELVFTCGVLIHQPQGTLPQVMAEIVRVSRRYVLAVEYAAASPSEVPYRGLPRSLFKRDFGRLYAAMFPCLRLLESGFLSKAAGWDDDTYWLFEKENSR